MTGLDRLESAIRAGRSDNLRFVRSDADTVSFPHILMWSEPERIAVRLLRQGHPLEQIAYATKLSYDHIVEIALAIDLPKVKAPP